MARDLRALLAASEQASGFLEEPVALPVAGEAPAGIGPYLVKGELGSGGMGTVYLAVDSRLQRQVALKILPPAFSSVPRRLESFRAEVMAASALNHPNVLTVFEVGSESGVHYFAAEYVKGETVRQLLARGPISKHRACDIAIQAARALAAAHAAGIVHRDIKPENIMVRDDGLVKVLDFGLAGSPRTQPVPAAMLMGTPAYMAPEQARGGTPDERSDIYSLGVVLREMTSSLKPPHRILRVAARATRRDPLNRYQTAEEFIRALERARISRTRRALPYAAVLLLGLSAVLYWFPRPPKSGSTLRMTRVTGAGNVTSVAISKDGRLMAYTGRGLRLREMDSGTERELVPQGPGGPRHVAFSPDGRSLYYGAGIFAHDLYRLALPSGTPQLLFVGMASGGLTFSPDGQRLAFPARNPKDPAETLLVVSDGSAQHRSILARWRRPDNLKQVAWSPDGRVIACVIEGDQGTRVMVLPAEGGVPRALGSQRWLNFGHMAWRGRGALVFSANAPDAVWFMPIWLLSFPSGQVQRLTPDLGSYDSVQVAGKLLAAVKLESRQTVSVNGESPGFLIGGESGFAFDLAWAAGGRILYTSDLTGELDIWSANAAGEDRRQLTRGSGANLLLASCGNGTRILFLPLRLGGFRLWTMNSDGSNPAPLTGAVRLGGDCSRDGQWAAYSDETGTWRVALTGGPPQRVTSEVIEDPQISPDGSMIAGAEVGRGDRAKVIQSANGQQVQTLKVQTFLTRVKWTPDGQGIAYVRDSEIWVAPLDGGMAYQLAAPQCKPCTAFSWSRDGTRFACARELGSSDVVLISGIP